MCIHVYSFECTYHVRTMYRHVFTFSEINYFKLHASTSISIQVSTEKYYRHVYVCTVYMTRTYYSIVRSTRHIHNWHGSIDMSVHVYAWWVRVTRAGSRQDSRARWTRSLRAKSESGAEKVTSRLKNASIESSSTAARPQTLSHSA